MTEQLEHELRRLFAEDAEGAPESVALAEHAQRRVRRHRQARLAWGAGLLVAASVAGVAVLGGVGPSDSPDLPPSAESSIAASPPASGPAGPLPDSGLASCAFEYSSKTLAERAFAFDGTVVSVGPGQTYRPGELRGLVGTTFEVHEWYAGGSGTTVTVDMPPPGSRPTMSDGPPTYEIGSRLLLSGEHRWGKATMDDALAWGCGFTRYYDEATADTWRSATR
ncbi:MAG: hypothetical protein Q8O61_05635 [Nocardioides sp.]|nr:hypothetical protein [Nocardioides sp.]